MHVFVSRYFTALLIALLVVALLSAMALSFDGFRDAFMTEDRAVETGSAVAFLLAALLCAVALTRGKGPIAVLIGGLALVAGLDELSFGERLFGFTPPTVYGTKIDAVHDFLTVFYKMVGNPKLFLALSVTLVMLAGAAAVYQFKRSASFRAFVAHPAIPITAAALTLIAIGQYLDIQLGLIVVHEVFGPEGVDLFVASHVEESAEFAGGLLVFVASLSLLSARDVDA